MIPYLGKTMIEHAVSTLNLPGNLYFIVKRDHLENHTSIEPLLKRFGGHIIISENPTKGAADTLLLSKPFIDHDTPLMSVNCDQHLFWTDDSIKFVNTIKNNPSTSYILTFSSNNPNYSYVTADNFGNILEVREKQVIGPNATVGMYHWAKAEDFFIDAERMILENSLVNGEFYVGPVYNYTINRGLTVQEFKLSEGAFYPVGTPDELDSFINISCIKS
jgi:dTDP-glucose pyrophosphorylase